MIPRLAAALALTLASAAVIAGIGAAPSAKPTDAYHERGRKIYNFRCYFCHGYSGDARTLASTFLNPKPRDFTSVAPNQLSRDAMLAALRDGRPGTAMKSFRGILAPADMEAVTDFVRGEFIASHAPNTRYHSAENGWPNHDRYKAAYPFVRGEIALDQPNLTPQQEAGRRLFRASCVTCHDQPLAAHQSPDAQQPATWETHPLSYPRNNYPYGADLPVDAMTSASVYLKHEHAPQLAALTPQQKQGEALFQKNCAFCHGADGTGRNWIGAFLEPHARDLTQPGFLTALTRQGLHRVIRDGLPGTSMPAWNSVLTDGQIEAITEYAFLAFRKSGS